MSKEQVLVAPAKIFQDYIKKDSITIVDKSKAVKLNELIVSRSRFITRDTAETNLSYRQIIPYVLVQCGSYILEMTRTIKQGEKRLYGKRYLGVGGHLHPDDYIEGSPVPRVINIMLHGTRRELLEEIETSFDWDNNLYFVGIILSDIAYTKDLKEVPVDLVHAGIFYHLVLQPKNKFSPRKLKEYPMHKHTWRHIDAILSEDISKYETWSQVIIQDYLHH